MKRFIVLAALAAVVIVPAACNLDLSQLGELGGGGNSSGGGGIVAVESDAAWDELKARAVSEFKVAAGWSTPQLVPGPVNSIGWEDSANISPDGKRLSFAYLPCDYFRFLTEGKSDLSKFEKYKRGPDRGMVLPFAIDTFMSKRKGDTWGQPKMAGISTNTDPVQSSESGMFEAADGAIFNNWNYPTSPTDYDNDLYRNGKLLPFNESYDDNDPSFANGELYFWSDHRPGGSGKMNIWMSKQTGSGWSDPVVLPAPINVKSSDSHQPHIADNGDLYFTSDRGGSHGIWVSKRTGDMSWSKPKKVIWSKSGSAAAMAAECTLTKDGRSLYFCAAFINPDGHWDLDIAYMTRED